MASPHDDILERLEVALHTWDMEIAQMRGALDNELDALNRQAELLPRAQFAPEVEPAKYAARAAQLEAMLEAAQTKALQLEQEIAEHKEIAADGNLTQRLAQALRDRDEAHQEIVALRAEVDLLRRANATLSGPVSPPEGHAAAPVEVFDAEGRRRRLGEILLELGLVTEEQLRSALNEQTESPHRRLGAILVENGVTSEEIVARILARQLGLAYVQLKTPVTDAAATRAVKPQTAIKHACVPVAVSPTRLVLAMANPFDLAAIEDIELETGRRVDPVVAAAGAIQEALQNYYESAGEMQ